MSTPNGTSLKGICYDGHHILEVFLPADHQEADNIMSCDEKEDNLYTRNSNEVYSDEELFKKYRLAREGIRQIIRLKGNKLRA